ncbi:unnamed protein product [Ixodes hexagonus]
MKLETPPPFLPTPGKPTIPWTEWYPLFETFLVASGATSYSDDRKKAILLSCLGVEEQRVFRSLPTTREDSQPSTWAAGTLAATSQQESIPTTSAARTPTPRAFDAAVRTLSNFFTPVINKTVERYRFRQRAQLTRETVGEYVTALRSLAKTCKFEALTEDLICDQLVEKTNTKEVRERLLLEPKLTLDAALVIAMQVEQALRESKMLTRDNNVSSISQVAALTRSTAKSSKQGQKCYRCGSSPHLADAISSPARAKTCKNAVHVVILQLYAKNQQQ